MQMIFPPGVPTFGCLPRKSKVGAICPLASERIPLIPEGEWDDLAAKQDGLRDFCTVLNQLQVGSCAAEGSTQPVHIFRALRNLRLVKLNPYFVYHTTSGGRDNGSAIDDNLAFVRQYGVAPQSAWPRSKGWRAEPSDEAKQEALKYRILEFYDVTTKQEAVSCLLSGFPVVYGANGHCVCKIKYLGNGKSLDVNSWGTGWGDMGFGEWASMDDVGWYYGAFAVREIIIPDLPPVPRPVR